MNVLVGADGKPLVIQKDGKSVFVGKEDPANPPVFPKEPNMRLCKRCKKEADNSHAQCPHCGTTYDDSKMECQVCHKWFDYLVGEDGNGGRQGCEADWKPPTERGGVYERPEGTKSDEIQFD